MSADRRTIGVHSQTGAVQILTDDAEKILVGSDIALALFGWYELRSENPADVVKQWLAREYDSALPFREQVEALRKRSFLDGTTGNFVAVCYRSGVSEVFRFNGTGTTDYDQRLGSDRATIKFNGSGNLIASALLDVVRPKLSAMSTAETVSFNAFVIRTTHAIMTYRQLPKVSVGAKSMAAILDNQGVRSSIS